jgi:hypothetical protein
MKAPRSCLICDTALWRFYRAFSQMANATPPTPEQPITRALRRLHDPNAEPLTVSWRNPRTPLAQALAQRWPQRVGLYLADEIHEEKDPRTDQTEAMMLLANVARRVVGLTGTLYGGYASGLWGLEHTFNNRVRKDYPWHGGLPKWVLNMGCLERIVENSADAVESGAFTAKRRERGRPKEVPGTSPLLISEIIDHVVMASLSDLGVALPDFEEIPVPLDPDPDVADAYALAETILKQYLAECRANGDSTFLGKYLQSLLSWPNAPWREERCIHNQKPDPNTPDLIDPVLVHTIPALPEDRLFAKEKWLIDLVNTELRTGRGVGIYVRQTGTRDIQDRISDILKANVRNAVPYILKGSVSPDKREETLIKEVKQGTNILISNPRLVMTGLDLIEFPTLIFFEPDYSLYVLAQAKSRARRPFTQTRACKVFYPYYRDTMEARAIQLIANKTYATALLYGDTTDVGLSAIGTGNSILSALASEIEAAVPDDLRALFARAAKTAAESDWLQTTPTPQPEPLTSGVTPFNPKDFSQLNMF